MHMKRRELVRFFVLMEIAEDYEEPQHIEHNVAERAKICGIPFNPEDVRTSLVELVESGLAKAYKLSTREPFVERIEGLPAPDAFEEYYFWITPYGKDSLACWRHEWPFDDEGEVLPGWSLPAE
jgi:hypothetical protein